MSVNGHTSWVSRTADETFPQTVWRVARTVLIYLAVAAILALGSGYFLYQMFNAPD